MRRSHTKYQIRIRCFFFLQHTQEFSSVFFSLGNHCHFKAMCPVCLVRACSLKHLSFPFKKIKKGRMDSFHSEGKFLSVWVKCPVVPLDMCIMFFSTPDSNSWKGPWLQWFKAGGEEAFVFRSSVLHSSLFSKVHIHLAFPLNAVCRVCEVLCRAVEHKLITEGRI